MFLFALLQKREQYIVLEDVIPGGEVVSEEEGIIEYKGAQYILGTNHLKMKKKLIEKLKLLEIGESVIVDMRYAGQIIVRNRNGS
ncbi:MAG: hypothetical protein JSU64_05515 [candidate division WOR-3 bacterium]|nr:MAG: hypothetical protein JSU64_05515 [candidate division WOR-3 bacterium]